MKLKHYVIGALFILAAIFPILFFPILAVTLLVLFGLIPWAMKHEVWHQTKEDIEEETRHHHAV